MSLSLALSHVVMVGCRETQENRIWPCAEPKFFSGGVGVGVVSIAKRTKSRKETGISDFLLP